METRRQRRRVPAWARFSLARLGFFAAAFVVVFALGGGVVLAAVIAAVVSLCLSVIFLGAQREALVGDLRRVGPRRAPGADEDAEDAEADGTRATREPHAAARDADPSPASDPDPGQSTIAAARPEP